MKITIISDNLINGLTGIFRQSWKEFNIAEGGYAYGGKNKFFQYPNEMWELPVNSNGAGVLLALRIALWYGRDEVLIPENTMRANYTVPKFLGMNIKTVPCSWDTHLSMSPEKLLEYGNKYSLCHSCVIVTPVGGIISNNDIECCRYAKEQGAFVILDAAHCHYLLNIPNLIYDVAVYSFYASKIIPLGEGGLIATPDKKLYDKLVRIVQYDKHQWGLEFGCNFRMDEYKAKMLKFLIDNGKEELVESRKQIAFAYGEKCKEFGVSHIGADTSGVLGYNGYKFIIKGLNNCPEELKSSMVFDRLVTGYPLPDNLFHTCMATYNTVDRGNAINLLNCFYKNKKDVG